MGNHFRKHQNLNIALYAPPLQQYKLKHCGINFYVWQHCIQKVQLIQFPINIYNQKYLQEQFQIFLFRHRHHLLVSNQYFRYNQSTGKASVFFERIFTNLSRIKDLQFEDSLIFYYIGLKGFQVLYRRYGYFDVCESMFHVSRSKRLKIWCNKDISKLKPKQMEHLQDLKDYKQKGDEQTMVKKIIQIIQQNTDPLSTNYPIGPILLQQASFSFEAAIQRLRQICTENQITIPEKLNCLDIIAKGQVEVLLDQFGQIREPDIIIQYPFQLQRNTTVSSHINTFPPKADSNQNSSLSAFVKPQIVHKIVKQIIPLNQYSQKKSKKFKGLKITHSLQKLQQEFNNEKENLPQYSPIKELEFNGNKHLTQETYIDKLNSHQSTGSLATKKNPAQFNPHKVNRTWVSPHPTIQYNVNSRLVSNTHINPTMMNNHQQIIRKNSLGGLKNNLNRPTQIIKPNTQYKVIVNYVHRPSSSGHGNTEIIHRNKHIYQTSLNNTQLKNYPPTMSRVKHEQNLRNIQNAYRRTKQNLIISEQIPRNLIMRQNSNITNQSSKGNNTLQRSNSHFSEIQSKISNETYVKTALNIQKQNIGQRNQQSNEQQAHTATTIFNRLKSINSYESSNSTNNQFQNEDMKQISHGLVQNKQSQFRQHNSNQNSTLKTRFDSYKRNFNFDKKETKFDPNYQKQYTNNSIDQQNQQAIQNVALVYQPTFSFNNLSYQRPPLPPPTHIIYRNNNGIGSFPQRNQNKQIINQTRTISFVQNNKLQVPKPFFKGILSGDTVLSYPDSNCGTGQKFSEINRVSEVESNKSTSNNQQNKVNGVNNQFPSNTDISDNMSYIPNRRQRQQSVSNKSEKGSASTDQRWRQQSIVVKHNPNDGNIKMPESRQYARKIDGDIWEDMQKVRAKISQGALVQY